MHYYHKKGGDNVALCACRFKVKNTAEDLSEILMMTTIFKFHGNSFKH